ncbi:MAG: RNB domain-containing ribonuclease [Thermoanaerobaculia bacterium]
MDLLEIARQAMVERELIPEFPREVVTEAESIPGAAKPDDGSIRDMRATLWCSIDNDDSRDLDQLTFGEEAGNGDIRFFVAVADVDALVRKGSAIDGYARQNTTSVYTPARIFPMLPERLSTDLTSLNEDEDRLAVVVEMVVDKEGSVRDGSIYRAYVHNHAKLVYEDVGAWFEGEGPEPAKLAGVTGLAETLRLQEKASARLKEKRHEEGALDLETIEPRAVMDGKSVVALRQPKRTRAHELIEDFMIAANGASARFLQARKFATIRRVVRVPERWGRIVQLAEEYGEPLPQEADAVALEHFLIRMRKRDPLRFPDLSLAVVKLLGKGEYALEAPGRAHTGHFGLAVKDYAHSTAPNRRYPDLITQRLLKAAVAGKPSPYSESELAELAAHCTEQEDDANKVERQVRKSAAALLLVNRIGQHFDGVVTGASAKGVWVRVFDPPVEGRVVRGAGKVDVGDRIRVKLLDVDVERGFIDFSRSKR